MKMKKKVLNGLIAYILTVVILSVTIGDAFITADDISTVEAGAVAVGGIAAASLAEICLMVGAVAVTLFCVGEVIDNREEIARFGYNLINSASETVDGWILSMIDTSGQEYVYGSEALDLIRDTEWEVIQGGLPPDDNNNNDDDKNNGQKPIKNPMQNLCNLTALGATWVMDNVSKLWKKWVNGETLTEAEQTTLQPLINAASCNQYDVAAQWSGEGFGYSGGGRATFLNSEGIFSSCFDITFYENKSVPIAGYFQGNNVYFVAGAHADPVFINITGYTRTFSDGKVEIMNYEKLTAFGSSCNILNFNGNFPIFSTKLAAQRYLGGTGPVTDALNYAKIYREADWLSDDWAGLLIDPLCDMGLSLSQLIEVAKQLGLHAIGNNLTPQQLYELLKALLAGENLGILPEIPPSPAPVPGTDPRPDPIYLPSPDAHPIPNPGTDPDPGKDPGKNPGTGKDPDPGENPDPGEDPDSGEDPDMKMADYEVDLRSLFPFCIPFDFVALLNALDADPVAPCFTFPVVIPALDYREDIKLDLSIFDDVAKVIRICEKVSFLIFLMFATSKVIRW